MSRPHSAPSWPSIKGQVGLALTVGTLAGVISQIPGGALADAVRWKRGLAAIGIGMICASALILALMPSFAFVFFAEILHGLTAGIITPAIAAISLGLVGRRAMSLRTGRNYRFDAAGNALTAGLMGLAGVTIASSTLAKTASYTSLPPAFSYSNSPTLRCCRLLVRTWRKARPNTHRYSWLA
jgi:MFS family permease